MENETRVALLGIIVENPEEIDRLNQILHDYAEYIIGRMGIPYSKKKMNVISIVMDAPEKQISALSGKIGMLNGITSKVIYGKKC
ncbi:MAG: iron-only hydrogenase system regulator [Lachnospiraceae bacterium]|nr:iron-only hydrogenase system regulator [Lachnospiraceae bacterium]